MEKMKTKGKVTIGAILIVALLVTVGFATFASANEVEPLSVNIDGGTLIIDETGGITCSANAGSYYGSYIPGLTYKIKVHCTYTDTSNVVGKTAYFKVTGPNGNVDDKSIYDWPIPNDSWEGDISPVPFEPNGPGTYHWTIYCSEGSESDTDIGDLILY